MQNYPEFVKIENRKVKINTDFKIALRCIEISRDTYIGDYERALAIIYLLFGKISPEESLSEYLKMAIKFLSYDDGKSKGEKNNGEADMDLIFDEKFIFASFLSDYGIDLTKNDMHFWKYCDLISGLSEKCVLNRVREIRSCDLNEYSGKYRDKLSAAKEELALPHIQTKEEREAEEKFERWLNGEVI